MTAPNDTPFPIHSMLPALVHPALDSVFWTPARLGVMSAWWGHVPFAHWLVTALEPRTVVELGTHNGASFAAFCEAVRRSGVPARCYAVDTWQGDDHAGRYGEEVFRDFSAFLQKNYAAFAEGLRMTFDDALPYFADGSVDLLHIDGLHTYEAVAHDFHQWLPKLSDRAVILFHDTNVRERGFGVWKLWNELRGTYPCFEFLHEHGLGIAAVGRDVPQVVRELCAAPEQQMALLRERFSQLGTRWAVAVQSEEAARHARNLEEHARTVEQHVRNLEQQGRSLEASRQHLHHEVAGLTAALATNEAGREHLAALLAEDRNTTAHLVAERDRIIHGAELLRRERDDAKRTAAAGQQRLLAADEHRGALLRQFDVANERHETIMAAGAAALHEGHEREQALGQTIHGLNTTIVDLHGRLTTLYRSTSWRVTRPIRGVRRVLRWALVRPARVTEPAAAPAPPALPEPPPAPEPEPVDPIIGALAASGLFDVDTYAGKAQADALKIDPIRHYLEFGEKADLAPSAGFDPAFYRARHPDAVPSGNLLVHYVLSGRSEGREALPVTATLSMPVDRLRAGLPTVVLIVHEASRTGAPILAWNIAAELRRRYNLVVLLRSGGPMADALDEQSDGIIRLPEDLVPYDAHMDALARALLARYAPVYVIANSVETRYYVPALERAGIPVVALVHEFSSSVRPLGSLYPLIETASKLVFSAKLVADAAIAEYPLLNARTFEVMPQGGCRLPPETAGATGGHRKLAIADLVTLPPDDGSLLVIGVGTITMRKGVEFFVAAAASVARRHPARPVRFVWIGDAYWFDEPYLDYIREQVRRSGADAVFGFAGEFADLEPVYARADLFFLSSRLDPMPNVTIDAALHGIPVICFDQASGCAELLAQEPGTAALVVPYLDVEAAARLVDDLAQDTPRLQALGTAISDFATRHFDMQRYVESLDACGRDAAAAKAQARRDAVVLSHDHAFSPALFCSTEPGSGPWWPDIAAQYLHTSRLAKPRGRPNTGMMVRRPLEGFHPLVYASDCAAFDETSGEDPLAHYIRAGAPAGRWKHAIIRPDADIPPSTLRVLLHGHFHYPELLEDLIVRLRRNQARPDLLLTTTSEGRAETLRGILARMEGPHATIEVTPNRGRDIGPMLTGPLKDRFADYDIVGHVHGKRSPHAEAHVGERWRNFTWEHLIGGETPILDSILAAMEADPQLGLVFPEDPHLNDWDKNREIADQLAVRLGLDLPLPNHFDFPLGTMFWFRPAALHPLQALNLDWDDYPAEPVPIDGSMLHALERLVPFSARTMGFRYAGTYVAGHRR